MQFNPGDIIEKGRTYYIIGYRVIKIRCPLFFGEWRDVTTPLYQCVKYHKSFFSSDYTLEDDNVLLSDLQINAMITKNGYTLNPVSKK